MSEIDDVSFDSANSGSRVAGSAPPGKQVLSWYGFVRHCSGFRRQPSQVDADATLARVTATAGNSSLRALEARLFDPATSGAFSEHELDELPDPVRRYFSATIAPGIPLARCARFVMRGSIKLGRRWLRFGGHEVLSPHHGLVWAVRIGGVITGSDQYADGEGSMKWKLLDLLPVVRAAGPEISRSAAGRVSAEAVWVPTSLAPALRVTWTASDEHHLEASYRLHNTELHLHIALDRDCQVKSIALERWGDPESTGEWATTPSDSRRAATQASAA